MFDRQKSNHILGIALILLSIFVVHGVMQNLYYQHCSSNLIKVLMMKNSPYCKYSKVILSQTELYFVTILNNCFSTPSPHSAI